MLIRQRRTMIDPILLDVICPFLRARGLDRVFPVARVWNYSLGSAPRPAAAGARAILRRTTWAEAGESRLGLVTQAAPELVRQKG